MVKLMVPTTKKCMGTTYKIIYLNAIAAQAVLGAGFRAS